METPEGTALRSVAITFVVPSHLDTRPVTSTTWLPSSIRRLARQKRTAEKKSYDPLWEQMYHHFTLWAADFNRHYHKRSNVETVFYMIKAKFWRQGAGQDGHRSGQRGPDEGAVPQHLRPDSRHVRAGHHPRLRPDFCIRNGT